MERVTIRPLIYPPLPRAFIINEIENSVFNNATGVVSQYGHAHTTVNSCTVSSSYTIDEECTAEIMEQADRLLQPLHTSEVAMTLLFSNNSTLLNESRQQQDIKINAAFIATATRDGNLHYISLHLVPKSSPKWSWIRDLLSRVMSSLRVIGYQMTEVLSTIITHFQLSDGSLLKWNVCDVGIGWVLIKHDDPVIPSYQQLLSTNGFDRPQVNDTRGYLSTVGPLMCKLSRQLKANNQWSIFVDMEMKALPIIAVMESLGVKIDRGLLQEYSKLLEAKINVIEHSIYSITGHRFNINSTQQLRKILYDDLKLDQLAIQGGSSSSTSHTHRPSHQLTKTTVHQFTSTSEQTLTQLQNYHPLPGNVLEYRQGCKVKSLIASLMECASASDDGCLRPCWQSIGSSTGRMSCSNPNIQGFPKHPLLVTLEPPSAPDEKSHVLVDIRRCIESRPDHMFVVSDFKSIELCLLAELSGDDKLIAVLKNAHKTGNDVFKQMASQWLGFSNPCLISDKEREKTKRIVYALIYGMGKEKLSQLLDISIEAAQQLIDSFLSYYASVKDFITTTIRQCRKTKWCSTMCGRQRLFNDIDSTNYKLKTTAERQCVNYMIQGSAADVCKVAMIQVQDKLAYLGIKGRLLVQVHDELVYEVHNTDVDRAVTALKGVMESSNLLANFTSRQLQVPLYVRIVTTKQWSHQS